MPTHNILNAIFDGWNTPRWTCDITDLRVDYDVGTVKRDPTIIDDLVARQKIFTCSPPQFANGDHEDVFERGNFFTMTFANVEDFNICMNITDLSHKGDLLRGALFDAFREVYDKYEFMWQHFAEDVQEAFNEIADAKYPMKCPKEGEFIGYKKAVADICGNKVKVLITLKIPAEAKRSSGISNKCRCSKAHVEQIRVLNDDNSLTDTLVNKANSMFSMETEYVIGEDVEADSFDENRWEECSNGIHFFMDEESARNYFM